MFWTRLASGIVLVVIAVVTIIAGGNIWFALVSALALIGLYELYKAMNIEKTLLGYAGYAMTVLYCGMLHQRVSSATGMAVVLGLLVMCSIYVFTFPKFKANQAAFAVFGFTYVPILMLHLYQIRELSDGLFIIPLVFLSAWGNDTCAYCVGMLIGKHKMAPKLSPKKSIEGLFGGIIGAALLGILYGVLCGRHLPTLDNAILACGIICGLGAVIAVVGDLTASAFKRDTGIKDYGKLIPGHGGVMDRFDSILFTAPVVYFLAVYFGAGVMGVF
ncbi:MAG: phosphatidate cytidylyltransferase [Clostridia bacterium]|nr:phosphatidate cytidylyltransferase [Lachnospiraceae bacterium]NCC00239.1 phosphatidate cytidylyltransferase [Clostridia bacterium]NCD02263.1 phosphatidate cytidylyltransferase [Clostridia bacterium]